MKSLILLLYLGAVVFTLAENPFEDKAVQKYVDAGEGETIAELADEDRPRPSGRLPRWLVRSPHLSPFLNRLLECGGSFQRPYKIGSKQYGKVPQQVL